MAAGTRESARGGWWRRARRLWLPRASRPSGGREGGARYARPATGTTASGPRSDVLQGVRTTRYSSRRIFGSLRGAVITESEESGSSHLPKRLRSLSSGSISRRPHPSAQMEKVDYRERKSERESERVRERKRERKRERGEACWGCGGRWCKVACNLKHREGSLKAAHDSFTSKKSVRPSQTGGGESLSTLENIARTGVSACAKATIARTPCRTCRPSRARLGLPTLPFPAPTVGGGRGRKRGGEGGWASTMPWRSNQILPSSSSMGSVFLMRLRNAERCAWKTIRVCALSADSKCTCVLLQVADTMAWGW